MLEIIPAILDRDWNEIEKKLQIVKPFAKTVQVDIIDGKFAPNTTFLDPTPFLKYSQELFLELHMMVDNPIQYLKPFAQAGFKRFIGHVEKMPDQAEFIAQAQLFGEAGLAIDIQTSIDSIKADFEDLDVLLFMAVKAGLSGQPFEKSCLKKIELIREKTSLPLELDGAINEQTIVDAKNSGANRFDVNSFLFKNNPLEQYKILEDKLKERR
jgi:ribulose-phosphate 3-epimerase